MLLCEYKDLCVPNISLLIFFFKEKVVVIEARVECIAPIASLINTGKHERIVRIANRGLRKGKNILSSFMS